MLVTVIVINHKSIDHMSHTDYRLRSVCPVHANVYLSVSVRLCLNISYIGVVVAAVVVLVVVVVAIVIVCIINIAAKRGQSEGFRFET